jgi:hypothetical protein
LWNFTASKSFVEQVSTFQRLQDFKDKKPGNFGTLKLGSYAFEPDQPFLTLTWVGPLRESGLSQTAEGETHALEGFSKTETSRS